MTRVLDSARKMTAQSQSSRSGPSNKNLGSNAARKPSPAPMIRSVAGRSIKGPDKGAGGM